MKIRSFWCAATIVLAATGCEKESQLQDDQYPKQVGDPPLVSVQEAGAAPQQALRIKPAVGTSQSANLQMTVSPASAEDASKKSAEGAGAAKDEKKPPPAMSLSMSLSSKVTKVEDSGAFHTEATVDRASSSNPQLAAMGIVDKLVGLKVNQVVSDRGVVTGGEVKVPEELAPLKPLLNDSLQQLAFSLPEEPVGVGATWVARETLMRNGMRVFQQTTFKVEGLTGGQAKLAVTLKQHAPRQEFKAMGQTLNLESLATEGSGTVVLDLARPLPMAMNLTLEIAITLKVNGQRAVSETAVEVDMSAR